jgi:hypothetical protein
MEMQAMTARRALPQRRSCETFEMEYGGLDKKIIVTVGYYEDGNIGEVFINFPKSGLPIEAIARDSAVLISMALQHGATLETIRGAVTRDARGEPSSVTGAVIDRLMERR